MLCFRCEQVDGNLLSWRQNFFWRYKNDGQNFYDHSLNFCALKIPPGVKQTEYGLNRLPQLKWLKNLFFFLRRNVSSWDKYKHMNMWMKKLSLCDVNHKPLVKAPLNFSWSCVCYLLLHTGSKYTLN